MLGYTDIDGNGIAGVEAYISQNRQLSITQTERCNLPAQQTLSSQCVTLGSRYKNTDKLRDEQLIPETYVKNNICDEVAYKAGFQCHSTGMTPIQLSLDARVQRTN